MRNATEFERLADAMLYQPLPRSRTPDRSGVLPSFQLDSDDDETYDAPASARVPQMRATPITPLLVLSDDDDQRSPLARAGYKHRPAATPPSSSRRLVDAPPSGPVILPAFMVLRGGAAAPRGLASSLVFLGVLALAVVTMVLFALAVITPGSDWALIQG